MLVTCAPNSNDLMGVNMFLSPDALLKRRWQLQRLFEQGNKHFILALALNRQGMHINVRASFILNCMCRAIFCHS